MTFRNLPPTVRPMVVAVSAAGLLLMAWVLVGTAPHLEAGTIGMIVAGGIAGLWQVDLGVKQGKMTLGSIVVVLGLLLYGDRIAILTSAFSAICGTLVKWEPKVGLQLRLNDPRVYFNTGTCALSTFFGAQAYRLAHAWSQSHGHDSIMVVGVAVTAFQTVYFGLNTAAVAIVLARLSGEKPLRVWKENFLWTGASYYAAASFGLLIYLLHEADITHAWAILLVPPLWFIYYFYRLHTERVKLFQANEDQSARHIQELKELNNSILTSLARAIDAKDRYTRSHISRVQFYAVSLAEGAGLTGNDLEAVRTGALVHDIGKIGIPERILGKPGKLSQEEFKRIQAHVTIGAEILAPVPFPFPVIPIVLSHHERWDGLGYPLGLKGEDIPIGGRIMAVADVFDALTSNRPYRPAMSLDAALSVLLEGSGKQFDPRLVELFSQMLPKVRERIKELEYGESRDGFGENGQTSATNWALSQIRISAVEMTAASDLPRLLADCTSEQQVLDAVLECVLVHLPVDTCLIYLCDPDSGALEARVAGGLYADKLRGITISRGEGVSGWVAEALQPQVKAQASLDIGRRFKPTETMELSSVAAVPLVFGGATIGVLAFYTCGYSVLQEQHLGLLNVFAEHTAAAIVNARRFEKTREMSLTDPLTGLPNSRSLIFQMEALCTRGAESRLRFIVMMLDLDGFKAVNDTHGHLRGDEALCEVAALMKRLLRPGDQICRYAGDEFVLLVKDGDERAAEDFSINLRRDIESASQTWVDGGISVSTGMAFYPEDGTEVRALLASADRRMYDEKFSRTSDAQRRRRRRDREAVAAG